METARFDHPLKSIIYVSLDKCLKWFNCVFKILFFPFSTIICFCIDLLILFLAFDVLFCDTKTDLWA